MEEATLGSEEVQFGRSEGPVDGSVGSEAGTVVGRPGTIPGGMVFSPGIDTWRAEVPGSLCKARGCFSGTESKALSSGENSASLTSRAKWQEVPTPAYCPREPEKCPNASALGGSADSSAATGGSQVSARDLGLISNSHCPAWHCHDSRAQETPVDEDPGIGRF